MTKFYQLPVGGDINAWLDAAVARLDGANDGTVLVDENGTENLSGAMYRGYIIVDGPDQHGQVLLNNGGIVTLEVSRSTYHDDGTRTREYRYVKW